MVFEHSNYRSFLKDVLAERQTRNPSYSLRAMARHLGMTPAHLSFLTNGKKGLSPQSAMRIAKALNLDDKATEYFCLLVQYEHAKTPELKDQFFERMRSIHQGAKAQDLNVDLFKMISDWYHIPILELTNLDDFDFNADNVAARLGITRLQAEVAIERLTRLELLGQDAVTGRWKKAINNYNFKSSKPNAALRAFHKQMLEKAIESLETQTPQEKVVGSQTFSIDVSQLEEARAIINEAKQKLVDLFNRGGKRTETYHLGIQLFRLTKGENEK